MNEYFYGKDAGLIYIKSICGNKESSATNITDLYYYDPQTTNKNRYSVTIGSANISYSSNGITVTGTTTTDSYAPNSVLTLPSSYEAELYITSVSYSGSTGTTKYYGGFIFDNLLLDFNNSKIVFYRMNGTQFSSLGDYSHSGITDKTIKIRRQGTTMYVYLNGNLIKTASSITSTGKFQYRTYEGRTLVTKDLKIHEL